MQGTLLRQVIIRLNIFFLDDYNGKSIYAVMLPAVDEQASPLQHDHKIKETISYNQLTFTDKSSVADHKFDHNSHLNEVKPSIASSSFIGERQSCG